jgi:aminoglycoside phosphotransferase (APT) family kinase protein
MESASHARGESIVPGIDLGSLRTWCRDSGVNFTPVFAELLEGGRSNITVALTNEAGERCVLRRPPTHGVLDTAHDMGREHRLISALAPTPLPVPDPIAFCDDRAVLGAPFYLMEFIPGSVLHGLEAAGRLTMEERGEASTSLIETLATLHGLDVDAIGLGQLAKRGQYVERQLRRWYAQYEASRTNDRDTTIERAHSLLLSCIPAQRATSVVHGDFRLGNCILSPTGQVRAVLDWEIATLGDPLADVGYVLATWPQTEEEARAFPDAPALLPGFASRDALLERYARCSGRDLSDIEYHIAFSYFRLACISQGVYKRALDNAHGHIDVEIEAFRLRAEARARLAHRSALALS